MSSVRLSPTELWICHLGVVPYSEAVALQERIRERRLAGELPDTLLLLEHPPVYTRGRRSKPEELALGADFYRAKGIDVVDTRRGGRVTYHGPGQLVGYPIMGVDDVGRHLRTIEQALIDTLAEYNIAARSRCAEGPDYTGVWVQDRKIASIGVHVSRGVSTHGFALNVSNDLEPFAWVVACGLADVAMTSIAQELGATGESLDPHVAHARATANFCNAHNRQARTVTLDELGEPKGAPAQPSATAIPDDRNGHAAIDREAVPA
jgi:lipoyl(octanoyl) transferase